jgi:hypothetical protein
MNPQQSDDELRLQMQQIAAAESDRGSRTSNPLAGVLGIGSIVLLVWALFALGAIIGQFVLFVHEATDYAASIFNSIRCLGPTCLEGSAIVALAVATVVFGFRGGRLMLCKGNAIAASVRRPRA